ncbi:hypothetical protein GEMRC1_001173 [Eukaryota sp. GEM-RC1]
MSITEEVRPPLPPSKLDERDELRISTDSKPIPDAQYLDDNHSPRSIHVEQSLLVHINSHLLRVLFKYSLCVDYDVPDRPFRRLREELPVFFEKIAYVSQRFFESALYSVKHFFQSNTLPIVSNDLLLLTLFSSLFKADTSSILFHITDSTEVEDIIGHSQIVSGLNFIVSMDDYFLTKFTFTRLTSSLVHQLTAVFSLKNTLTSASISNVTYGDVLLESELVDLFNAIADNIDLVILNLFDFDVRDSSMLLPLFTRSALKHLKLPRVKNIAYSVFSALRNNRRLMDVNFTNWSNLIDADSLSEVLNFNTFLKKAVIVHSSDLSHIVFKSLGSNISLIELVLISSAESVPFTNPEALSLKQMLQENSSLIVLTVDGSLINSKQFKHIFDGLQGNCRLKSVSFPSLDLSCLVTLMDALSTTFFKI